jgi:hypothetical protein
VFTALGGASFAGLLPKTVLVLAACVAFAALIAVVMFRVEARNVGLALASAEAEHARTELERRAPVANVSQIDPTQIGVDRAAQDILRGGEVPEYVARDVDDELRAAVAGALDGSGRWLVVVIGPSKVGKSRALFEAVTECARGRRLELVAPVDAGALRDVLRASAAAVDAPAQPPALTVLWLDDLEPFLNDGVTLATLRDGGPARGTGSWLGPMAARAVNGSPGRGPVA